MLYWNCGGTIRSMSISSQISKAEEEEWVAGLGEKFALPGAFVSSFAIEVGHINSTYKVVYEEAEGGTKAYVFQKLNAAVFPDPEVVMNNVQLVTEHIRQQCEGEQVLRLFLATTGKPYVIDTKGAYWRCYNYIDHSYSVDVVENEEQAYAAAKAFGHFLELVSDLEAAQLSEVIEDFHHTPKRLERLKEALESDVLGRAADVAEEVQWIYSREEVCCSLQHLRTHALVPDRVTHNDTKINNVMLSQATNEGVCVIDLDTVMPGLSLYDFGDLVRTSVSPTTEDETDLTKIEIRWPIFEALCRGFLEGCPSLTCVEKEHLVLSTKVITMEVAIRFLTDYVQGDVYFKVDHSQHNLERCRNQLQLVRALEMEEDKMQEYVREVS